jgi:chromosome segregation ATPase
MSILLTMFIIVFLNFNVNAVTPTDVSKDHWAYSSIIELIDKGYLSLYDDGTFKGANKVSRFEIAELIARILNNISKDYSQVEEDDINTIRKLSLEFREELVNLAKNQDLFTNMLKELKQDDLIQGEDIANVNLRINKIEEEITQIIDNILEIKKLSEKLEKLNNTVITLESELKANIYEQDNKLNNLEKSLNEDIIKDLQDQQIVNMTKVNSLQNKINEFQTTVISNEAEINKLKDENEKYKLYIAAVALLALIL